nr:leucine-rich repeat-containing protein 15-like [Penaeus vannamei]
MALQLLLFMFAMPIPVLSEDGAKLCGLNGCQAIELAKRHTELMMAKLMHTIKPEALEEVFENMKKLEQLVRNVEDLERDVRSLFQPVWPVNSSPQRWSMCAEGPCSCMMETRAVSCWRLELLYHVPRKQQIPVDTISLDLGMNRLRFLHKDSFNSLTELAELDLNDNELELLPYSIFYDLENLRHLKLHKNRLLYLPQDIFQDARSLRTIDVSHNVLEGLPSNGFKKLYNLYLLNLASNAITHLDEEIFFDLENLEDLDLSENKLKAAIRFDTLQRYPFMGKPFQCGREVRGNCQQLLTSFTPASPSVGLFTLWKPVSADFIGLVMTDCTDMDMTALVEDLRAFLNTIQHQENYLTPRVYHECLRAIEATSGADHTSLQVYQGLFLCRIDYWISGIVIRYIHGRQRLPYRSAVSQLREVVKGSFSTERPGYWHSHHQCFYPAAPAPSAENYRILLMESQSTEKELPQLVFYKLRRLKRLKLYENELTRLPYGVFTDLFDLQELHLQNNFIESLPTGVFGHLTNLTFLELTSNRIKAIEYRDFIALGNLRSLFLGQNSIIRISNKTFVEIEENMSIVHKNFIHHAFNYPGSHRDAIDLFTVPHVQICKKNVNFYLLGTPKLEKLYLFSNKIEDIELAAFSGLNNLAWLLLNNNLLRYLPREIFRRTPSLLRLQIDSNKFMQLPEGLLDELQIVEQVKLSMNPWHCDCFILYLTGWLHRNPDKIWDRQPKCRGPGDLGGKPVIDMTFNSVCDGQWASMTKIQGRV